MKHREKAPINISKMLWNVEFQRHPPKAVFEMSVVALWVEREEVSVCGLRALRRCCGKVLHKFNILFFIMEVIEVMRRPHGWNLSLASARSKVFITWIGLRRRLFKAAPSQINAARLLIRCVCSLFYACVNIIFKLLKLYKSSFYATIFFYFWAISMSLIQCCCIWNSRYIRIFPLCKRLLVLTYFKDCS